MAPWVLISPASQGVGFALAKRILETTKVPVVVTARAQLGPFERKLLGEVKQRDAADRLKVLKLNFLAEDTIKSTAGKCESFFPADRWHLHLAMILPGFLSPETSPTQIRASRATKTFLTNTIGPMLAMNYFANMLPSKRVELGNTDAAVDAAYTGLPRQAVWANMSARVGSITDNRLGGWYSYRASKAAVNQITKTFDNHLKTASGANAMAVAMHPGTVKTELSRRYWSHVVPNKLFEPDSAAEKLLDVINGLDVEKGRGRCWDWKGEEVPP
ncbi:NAD(P)-binding protein [Saccharata proteae CBS 121410]|uniref:NAD(P)-binding protein n=1 Tax=Saccharata proteae CBS 121410 TaxID=1314787 RepID=A0A9P4LVT1_9PEZI|nr:NAD(P)-binding protein [Saccharata proteae CBS 121410]